MAEVEARHGVETPVWSCKACLCRLIHCMKPATAVFAIPGLPFKAGQHKDSSMEKLQELESVEDIGSAPHAPGLPPFDAMDVARHHADAHWQLLRDGAIAARCSLWWTSVPLLPGETIGCVGHFAAVDESAATRLLDHVCSELAGRGCTVAIGPMDGNTWRRYRLLTRRGAEPPFFLEPDNPDEWPGYLLAAEFSPMTRYFSALCTDLTYTDPRLQRVAPRMDRADVTMRTIDPGRLEEELRAIHSLSLISFRDNFLYTPISEEEFIVQYRPLLPLVRPELVWIAEQKGRCVGFLFAVPDLLQAKRGDPVDTIVVKTAAVLPGREYAGLGNLLVARCHAAAGGLGYRRAIHALMHQSNESRALSGHYGLPFREYTLYSRNLMSGA